MKKDAPAPVLIAGYMRSGTTLLHNVLARHPDAYHVQGDRDFFQQLPLIRRAFPDLEEDDQLRRLAAAILQAAAAWRGLEQEDFRSPPSLSQVKDIPAECREAIWREVRQPPRRYGRTYRVVFEHLARRAGKSYWVKKALDYTAYLDEILEALPRARFVQAVRDPRDVLASKKTRRTSVLSSARFSEEARAREHIKRRYDPLWDAFAWKMANRVAQRAKARDERRLYTMRYEDLVMRPEATARRLCAFLDWPFAPEMLEVTWRNASEERKRSDGDEASGRARGIQPDSVERWRTVLAGPDVAICQWMLSGEMQHHGYERAAVSLQDRARVPARLAGSVAELAGRLRSKWQTDGRAHFGSMLISYGKRLGNLMAA